MGANPHNCSLISFAPYDHFSCVSGGFLRWCLLEFERLSFAQVCHLQKEWKEFATNEISWKESLSVSKVVHACSTTIALLLILRAFVPMLP